jgi:hypothetical protein
VLLCAVIAVLALPAAGPVRADHGMSPGADAMNPWVEALLWGALGLAVATVVALIVMVFTRAPTDQSGRRRT